MCMCMRMMLGIRMGSVWDVDEDGLGSDELAAATNAHGAIDPDPEPSVP